MTAAAEKQRRSRKHPDGFKTCRDCGELKPYSDLRKHAACKHGVDALCNECGKKIQARYRNRHNMAAYHAEWRKNNPDKVKAAQQRYAKKNPDNIKSASAKYRKTLYGRYQNSIKRAERRGIVWDLPMDKWMALIEKDECCYCKGSLVGVGDGSGMDQKIPSAGYTEDNVVPCCKPCNIVKNNILTHEEMLVAMKAVMEFRERQGTRP